MKPICLLQLSICLVLLFSSCKKEPGPGGTSSIKGKVYATYYDKSFYALTDSSYAPDVDVYIIYGGQTTYGNHQKTSYDGAYEFKYLRNGAYKIYVLSRDSTGLYKNQANRYAPSVAVIKNVDITKRNQTVQISDLHTIQ